MAMTKRHMLEHGVEQIKRFGEVYYIMEKLHKSYTKIFQLLFFINEQDFERSM